MVQYCEGAAAAEIIFSLTGGKEGRLISYAPPVDIFFGTFKTVKLTGDLYKTILQPEINNFYTVKIKEGVLFSGAHYNSTNTPEIGIISSDYFSGAVRYVEVAINRDNQRVVVYKMPDNQFVMGELTRPESFFNYRIQSKYGLLIQDTEGILYAYDVPQGFTPTWQVNCIGCSPGECAGSDGKGGVVCMDCGKMDRDIQAIKRTLSK